MCAFQNLVPCAFQNLVPCFIPPISLYLLHFWLVLGLLDAAYVLGTVWNGEQDIGNPRCFIINNFIKERCIKTVEEQMYDYRLDECNGGRIHCIWSVEEKWPALVWQGDWARKGEKSISSENFNSNKNSQRKWEEKGKGKAMGYILYGTWLLLPVWWSR